MLAVAPFTYSCDYRGRLILVEYDNGDDVAEYRYDGQNRRIYKKVVDGNKETVYIYDGWQVLEERELDGETRKFRMKEKGTVKD